MEGVIALIFIGVAIWLAIKFWYVALPLAAVGVWYYFDSENKKADAKRREEAAARKATKDAEDLRHRNEQSAHRQEMVQLGEQSLGLFEAAPAHLDSAESYLDQAERDFSEGVFAPFWDSVERAANTLGRFDEGVRGINEKSSRYTGLIKVYESKPPLFPLSRDAVSKLAAGTGTAERMKVIVRNAQRNFQFSTIYEQRKTNQVLVAGFTNLAQALDQMTWRITTSIDDLSSSVQTMGSTLNESMRAVDNRLGDIQRATAEHHETILKHEGERGAREQKTVAMLDNIQRRRKPWP